jgi:hypothetical protein
MRKLVLKMLVSFDWPCQHVDGDVGRPVFAFVKMLINTSAAFAPVLLVPLDAARVSVEVIRTSGAESPAEKQA